MGRELRRKQAKRDGKSLEREEINEGNQIKKLITTTCIIVIILGMIYLLSALFITKELDWFNKDKEEESEKTNTVSNSILASAIFKQSEEEYYVYLYDFDEKENQITSAVNRISDKKVYKVDTSSAMNSNYVSDVSNKKAKKLEDLKVVPQTLIKISGDTITEYYEKEEITKKFN